MNAAVATRDLVKRYGRRCALDGFSLEIPRGSVTGLVGPNGAGKTTWMMAVAGFLKTDSGTVDVLGQGPFDAAVHSGRVAILPQDSEMPPEACPRALLVAYARLQGLSAPAARRSADEVLAAVNLLDRAESPIRTLSHGMRRRVAVAQCFLGAPELVLLDEPLNGLDPVEADRLRRYFLSHRGRRTLVVSSHNLNDVETLSTHVAFIAKGRVTRFAETKTLTRDSGRVVYGLSREPSDRAALEAALPGASFVWSAAGALECAFDAETPVADVNRRLLPVLLAQGDVLSVTPGQSLEQVYLKEETSARPSARGPVP